MAETRSSRLAASRTDTGHLVHVIGHGTMRESRVFHQFAIACLCDTDCTLAVDLNECEHLDSTFLGCLVGMHKRLCRGGRDHFHVVVTEHRRQLLLEPTCLHKVLRLREVSPNPIGERVDLTPEITEANDLGAHIMVCHRMLADIEGPNQSVFRRIADQLEKELERQ